MTTYFDLLKNLRQELGGVKRGTAEAGSDADTLVDSNRYESSANHFNRGQIFIVETTDGLAPQSEVKMVATTGHSATIGSYKANSSFSAAIEAGDVYHITPGKFKLDDMKMAINRVIEGIWVEGEDVTSLTFDDEQMKYTLPAAIPYQNLLQVWLQVDSDPHKWVQHAGWEEEDDDLLLYGLYQPSLYDDNAILLKYKKKASTLSAMSDTLNEQIHQDIVIYEAAKNMVYVLLEEINVSPRDNERYVHFANNARQARLDNPISLPEKPIKSSGLGMPQPNN